MAKLLAVEDDLNLLTTVCDVLSFDMHQIETCSSGLDGFEMIKAFPYDLIILDWDLPEMTGLDICRKFRWGGGLTPVLMLTGKSSAEEKELALDSGADDYVCKPFSGKELRARVRALLRRPQQLISDILSSHGIVLDPRSYSATVDDVALKLTTREFALLELFMRFPNQAFAIEALLARLWPNSDECSEEAVRMAVKRLREKLGKKGSMLQTIYGAGYLFSTKD